MNENILKNWNNSLNENENATKGVAHSIFALNKEAKQEAQHYENQKLIKQIIRAFHEQHRLYLGHEESITGLFLYTAGIHQR